MYVIMAGIMALTIVGMPYARLCLNFAWYFWWPFGRYVEGLPHDNISSTVFLSVYWFADAIVHSGVLGWHRRSVHTRANVERLGTWDCCPRHLVLCVFAARW